MRHAERSSEDGALVRGWCPGVLRPMRSGDGLVVRIRPRVGRLSADVLQTIAGLARDSGNGVVELTRAANLQLRGMHPNRISLVRDALSEHDLVDPDTVVEASRNLLVSPLAGLDPTMQFDVRPVAAALEAGLAAGRAGQLPPKFSFLVDGGGRLALNDVAADIRLSGSRGRVLVALGGDAASADPVAEVEVAAAAETALRLARAFADTATRDGVRRMRELADPGALARAAGLPRLGKPVVVHRQAGGPTGFIGWHGDILGVGAPFGSLSADSLSLLASLTAEVRLTPWRALLLVGATRDASARLAGENFILDPLDPRLRVVACPGSPACAQGEVETRTLATQLAPLAASVPGDGIALHVSGCAKGCAGGTAPFVLTGVRGRYDLARDARAGGAPIRIGLPVDAVGGALAESLRHAVEAGR